MIGINSRADLEALRGTDAFVEHLRGIYGAMTIWSLVDDAWVAAEDLTAIERLGFTKAEFLTETDGLGFSVEPPPPLPEPPSTDPGDYVLSARQLRLGLVRHGHALATIQAIIDAIPDQADRDEAQVWWEFSNFVHWLHPMTQTLLALSGISVEDAAAMWLVAKDYEA